jgi:DNA-binding protein HU-beta
MTKTELIYAASGASAIPPDVVGKALNALLDGITEAVGNGDTVTIPGFGTFSRKHREARTCRNPQTGEPITVPACYVPSFKAGKRLKDAVNGK